MPDMTLADYVAANETIRARMIASRYPNIREPSFAVEFLIEGLMHNQATTNIGLQLLANQPSDVKDFTHQFIRIKEYQDVTPASPMLTFFPQNYWGSHPKSSASSAAPPNPPLAPSNSLTLNLTSFILKRECLARSKLTQSAAIPTIHYE